MKKKKVEDGHKNVNKVTLNNGQIKEAK